MDDSEDVGYIHGDHPKGLHGRIVPRLFVVLPSCLTACGAVVFGAEGSLPPRGLEAVEDKDGLDGEVLEDAHVAGDVLFEREGHTTQSRHERLLRLWLGEESPDVDIGIDAQTSVAQG